MTRRHALRLVLVLVAFIAAACAVKAEDDAASGGPAADAGSTTVTSTSTTTTSTAASLSTTTAPPSSEHVPVCTGGDIATMDELDGADLSFVRSAYTAYPDDVGCAVDVLAAGAARLILMVQQAVGAERAIFVDDVQSFGTPNVEVIPTEYLPEVKRRFNRRDLAQLIPYLPQGGLDTMMFLRNADESCSVIVKLNPPGAGDPPRLVYSMTAGQTTVFLRASEQVRPSSMSASVSDEDRNGTQETLTFAMVHDGARTSLAVGLNSASLDGDPFGERSGTDCDREAWSSLIEGLEE